MSKQPVYHFPALVEEMHRELTGKAPAEAHKPAMVKSHRATTDADLASFWGRSPSAKPKPVVMVKAKGPSRADIKRAGQAKLAKYVAETDRLARSGQLSGVEGARCDAEIARLARAIASL